METPNNLARRDAAAPGGGSDVNASLQSDHTTSPRAIAAEQRATPSRDQSPKLPTGAASFCGSFDLLARLSVKGRRSFSSKVRNIFLPESRTFAPTFFFMRLFSENCLVKPEFAAS